MGSIATLSNERAGIHEATQGLAELPRQGEGFDFERIYRMYSRNVFALCAANREGPGGGRGSCPGCLPELELHTSRNRSFDRASPPAAASSGHRLRLILGIRGWGRFGNAGQNDGKTSAFDKALENWRAVRLPMFSVRPGIYCSGRPQCKGGNGRALGGIP